MGFHSVLTGEDLHEPSRIRILNDVRVSGAEATLLPNQLVQLDGTVIEGVLTVSALAGVGETRVGFVDTIIPFGNEASIVLFGRLLNVEVENPATNPLVAGDILRVNSLSRFEQIDSQQGRVATVLRRGSATAPTMDVLFNPINAIETITPQVMVLDRPDGLMTFPSSYSINIANGETTGQFDEQDLTFSNSSIFSQIAETDALELIDISTMPTIQGVSIKQTGTYEFSLSSNAVFPTSWAIVDQTTPDGGQTVASFVVMAKLEPINGSGLPVRVETDIYRCQVSESVLNPAVGTILNLNRELEAATTTSPVSLTDPYSLSTNSKLVNLTAGDVISFKYTVAAQRDAPTNASGTVVIGLTTLTPAVSEFDLSLSIRRIT